MVFSYEDYLLYTVDVMLGIAEKEKMLECFKMLSEAYPTYYQRMIDDLQIDEIVH